MLYRSKEIWGNQLHDGGTQDFLDMGVHLFKDFQYKTFRDFLCFQIAVTRSIFELEKFFLTGQNFIIN